MKPFVVVAVLSVAVGVLVAVVHLAAPTPPPSHGRGWRFE